MSQSRDKVKTKEHAKELIQSKEGDINFKVRQEFEKEPAPGSPRDSPEWRTAKSKFLEFQNNLSKEDAKKFSKDLNFLKEQLVFGKLYSFWDNFNKIASNEADKAFSETQKNHLGISSTTHDELAHEFFENDFPPDSPFVQKNDPGVQFIVSGMGAQLKELCERSNDKTAMPQNKEAITQLRLAYDKIYGGAKTGNSNDYKIGINMVSDLLTQLRVTTPEDKALLQSLQKLWLRTVWDSSKVPEKERVEHSEIRPLAQLVTGSTNLTAEDVKSKLNELPFPRTQEVYNYKGENRPGDRKGNIDFAYASPLGFQVCIDGPGHDLPEVKERMKGPILEFNRNLEKDLVLNGHNLKTEDDVQELIHKHMVDLGKKFQNIGPEKLGKDYPGFSFNLAWKIDGKPKLFSTQIADSGFSVVGKDGKLKGNYFGDELATGLGLKHESRGNMNWGHFDMVEGNYAEKQDVLVPKIKVIDIEPGDRVISYSDGYAEFVTPNEWTFLVQDCKDFSKFNEDIETFIRNKAILYFEGRLPIEEVKETFAYRVNELTPEQLRAIKDLNLDPDGIRTNILPPVTRSVETYLTSLEDNRLQLVNDQGKVLFANGKAAFETSTEKLIEDYGESAVKLDQIARKSEKKSALNGGFCKILFYSNQGCGDDVSLSSSIPFPAD